MKRGKEGKREDVLLIRTSADLPGISYLILTDLSTQCYMYLILLSSGYDLQPSAMA